MAAPVVAIELRNVPMEDVVLFAAGRAEGTYSASKEQGRADGDEYGRQKRFQLRQPMSDDGKISG
jgi:hypothetical protein